MRHALARLRSLAVVLAWGSLLAGAAATQVQTLEMPADYANYALNPETGDLAAIAAETSEAVLFRAADLKAGRPKPAATARVGSTPCSIFFKRFGDLRVFAVVCSQDSHMYLIQASDGSLLKKIELAQSGVSHVTGSINPADPFVYYNYGGGHDSFTGVVNLRTMKSYAPILDDSMDCVVSASGEIVYRRGPWSPSGFESLVRTNRLADDKPRFASLYREHTSSYQYLPDPFDRYTASGTGVYTRTLEKREASLDFIPRCFFRTRPVLIGVGGRGDYGEFDDIRGGQRQQEVKLQAASYNTFQKIGGSVTLRMGPAKDDGSLPRGVSGDADYKRVAKTTKVFADDGRDRVVYAARDRVFLVPLAEFQLPEEPFLLATLRGPSRVPIGKDSTLTIEPMDPRVEVVIQDLPEGMKADGNQLSWRPAASRVGPAKLAFTLKHGEIQRSLTFEIAAVLPSLKLPFSPTGMAISPDAKRAAIWDGPDARQHWIHDDPPGRDADLVRLALVDLAKGEPLAERKLAEPVRNGFLEDKYVVLLPEARPARCDVLDAATLERVKSLVSTARIRRVAKFGAWLVMETEAGMEVYQWGAFDRATGLEALAAAQRENERHPAILTRDGLVARGLLLGADLKPQLLLDPLALVQLPGADPEWQPASLKEAVRDAWDDSRVLEDFGRRDEWQRVASAIHPETGTSVHLDVLMKHQPEIGVPSAARTVFELALMAHTPDGEPFTRQVLQREERPSGWSPQSRAVLSLAGGEAFVAHGDELYRWSIPPSAEEEAAGAPLELVPRQSAFTLGGAEKTVLKHEARGGRPPLRFSLLTPYDAMTIDEVSGDVTIDDAALLAESARALERQVRETARGQSLVDALRAQAVPMISRSREILGRQPQGAPVAIPIRIDVADAASHAASLQYFVLAEVPSGELLEKLRTLDEQRQHQAIPAGPQPGPADGDLRRRVEALEQRLDLVTRQLNEVLKRLEEK